MKQKRPFPLRFLIKGALWRVKFKNNPQDDEGAPCHGLTDFNTRIIYIGKHLIDPHLEWVFWHEYCHAMLYESCVVGNTGGVSDLIQEIICDNFADAMVRDKTVKWKRIKKEKL